MNPIYALTAATFAMGTQSYVFSGLLSEMAADLAVPVGLAGQLASAFALTFALAAPLAGAAAAGWERRGVLTAGLVAVGLLNLLAAVAPGFGELLGLRIAAAVAAAFVGPLASATAVALAAPERRGRALATVTAGLTVAFTLGIPLGSAVGGAFGWRACFAFAGLVALAVGVVVRLALPRTPAPPKGATALGALLKAPGVTSSFALAFLGFAATFTVVAYMGPVVNAVTGLAGGAVGPFQAMVGGGSLVGVVLGGRLADGARTRAAFIGLFGLMAAVLALYAPLIAGAAGPAGPVLLGAVILTSAAALFTLVPLTQARLARAAPGAGPVLFGLNGTMIFAGQGAGAAVGGLATETLGFASVGVIAALVALGGVAAALAAPRLSASPA